MTATAPIKVERQARMSADERRSDIVAHAFAEFALGGYAGTSTESIAKRAGVSQPYLFQLFGTKKELFLAVVRESFDRTASTFEAAGREARGRGLDPRETLAEMGKTYLPLLLRDRDLLRVQLVAFAAAARDPEIKEVVGASYREIWRIVAAVSGADRTQLVSWFAKGALINMLATIEDAASPEEFEQSLECVVAREF